jgi:acyl-coenzyme A synthetase/AMP-(fatty) acid ligase
MTIDKPAAGRKMTTKPPRLSRPVPAYKLPRSVLFVPDLPKTSTGKVMRRELKTFDS